MNSSAGRAVRASMVMVVSMATGSAAAQTTPPAGAQNDPGVISSQQLNQQRREVQAPVTPAEGGPAVTGTPVDRTPAATLPGSVRFHLAEVRFGESRFLTPEELRTTAAPYLGTEIGFAELNRVVDAVNKLYEARGLVTARAVLGPQSIEGGVIRIDLIEGRVGNIQVSGNRVLSREDALARAGLKPGETVDVPRLQRRLSLLNRTTDVQTRVALQPGQQFGLTDIQLSVVEPPRDVLQLIVDDWGYETVGRWEGGALYRHSGLIGASDRFTGYFTASDGALSGTASYDAPIAGPSARAGISYGRSRSEIVVGPFAALGSVGKTESVALNYSEPLASSETGLLIASLTTGVSTTRNYISDTYLGRTTTRKVGGGLVFRDARPGAALDIAVNALAASAPLSGQTGRQAFGVFSGTVTGEMLFTPTLGLRVNGGWQVATADGLPGDQLFQIGGASTVRGYRQGMLSGDGGYYVQTEFEVLPAKGRDRLTLFAFFDHGRTLTQLVQPRRLAAAGLGMNTTIGRHLSLQGTAGYPLIRVAGQPLEPQLFARLGLSL